jgi:hypothetical protein
MNTVTKLQAILSLVPGAEVTLYDDEVQWINPSTAPVTEQQIATEKTRLQVVYNAQEYQRLRQYPSIGDQLDMLWHAIDNGTLNKTSDFYTAIKAVKDAHPKE